MKSFFIISLIALVTASPAHEGDCPYCKLKLVQNTKDQDNEVVVKFGNKRIEYRCITCVFKDQARYKSDLIVYAPSEKVGEPVILKRTSAKWSAPNEAVFLNSFTKHADCAALSRAFSSKAAFDDYVKRQGIEKAKPLSLDEFIASTAKAGKE